MKVFRFFFTFLFWSFSSCTLFVPPVVDPVPTDRISNEDLTILQRVYMSSYYASSKGMPAGGRALLPRAVSSGQQGLPSRATVLPKDDDDPNAQSMPFATLISGPNTSIDYPELGMSTTYTVSVADSTNNIYKILATTTFASDDARSSYVEEYYVKDVRPGAQGNGDFTGTWASADGEFSEADPIVQSGALATPTSTQPWVWNQNYRLQMKLTFDDGTVRNEKIVSSNNPANTYVTTTADPRFDSTNFDINGSLDLSQIFVPSASASTNLVFSSVVVYEITPPAQTKSFTFWTGSESPKVVGIRYYTEEKSADATTLTGSTISFEKTLSNFAATGGSYAGALSAVVGGSSFNTLAESVLREKIVWPLSEGEPVLNQATITKKMQMRVIDVTGQSAFYVTQLNNDYAQISSFQTTAAYAPVGVITPTYGAAETGIYTRTSLLSSLSGQLPLVASDTIVSGLGTLAQVYTGIRTGAITVPAITPTPPSDPIIVPAGGTMVFDGANTMGKMISPPQEKYRLGKTGWLEAWVKYDTITDSAGFISYGEDPNWTDNGYALQGLNNDGTVALFVTTGNGATYDYAASAQLLSIGVWYHIVGVWDFNRGTSSYISVFINGVKQGTNTNINSTLRTNGSQAATYTPVPDPQVMIGSLLPVTYSGMHGYFGLDGKITGVNIKSLDGTASTEKVDPSWTYDSTTSDSWVAAKVVERYNANKDNTSGW